MAKGALIGSGLLLLGGVAAGMVAVNVPLHVAAPLFDAGDYDPALEPLVAHVSGSGCTPDDRDHENLIIDGAIAKATPKVAERYAHRKQVEVMNRAGRGEKREHILRAKGLEIEKTALFSAERRQKIAELNAMIAFLDEQVAQTRAPVVPGTEVRYKALEEALSKTQCPNDVSRLRNRIAAMQTRMRFARLEAALLKFREDTGVFPSSDGHGGLHALVEAPKGMTGWKGPYADADDFVDGWGKALLYGTVGDAMYKLASTGADKNPGGRFEDEDLSVMGSARIAGRMGTEPMPAKPGRAQDRQARIR